MLSVLIQGSHKARAHWKPVKNAGLLGYPGVEHPGLRGFRKLTVTQPGDTCSFEASLSSLRHCLKLTLKEGDVRAMT